MTTQSHYLGIWDVYVTALQIIIFWRTIFERVGSAKRTTASFSIFCIVLRESMPTAKNIGARLVYCISVERGRDVMLCAVRSMVYYYESSVLFGP